VTRAFDLFLSAEPHGYMTSGEDRCSLVMCIRKSRLISACAALAGLAAEDIRLSDMALSRQRFAGKFLHHRLVGAAKVRSKKLIAKGLFAMSEELENDLASLIAAQLVPSVRRGPEVNPYRVNELNVVRKSIAVAKARPESGLADLCAASGVSQRWLHHCFMGAIGVSPYHYIRFARLTRARELLLTSKAAPTQTLVKSVALSVGYRLSGRFAKEYRSVYRENPSDTLGRPQPF
jgi:AraC-like DNA-binding protein